ncbi:hypothetical protein RCO27_10955 [Sphingosinicella sp. LHD-64]|uniref:hypothetical protein n=1 Tax=Sphingosinicella sp. LHD-64 TaxID=3072139 RepID=UPI00280FF52C|nr:hypothetical protein [Sphingosinicella sp. LHD-64]MDQ8756747.1 hypothetical protein [Sphingosinicella sp. LHD-64]
MTMRFKSARAIPRLSPAQQERQGRVVKAAQSALPGTDAVRTFLNTHHDLLRARPLDLAIASDVGLIAVEGALLVESRRLEDAGAGEPPVPQDAAP